MPFRWKTHTAPLRASQSLCVALWVCVYKCDRKPTLTSALQLRRASADCTGEMETTDLSLFEYLVASDSLFYTLINYPIYQCVCLDANAIMTHNVGMHPHDYCANKHSHFLLEVKQTPHAQTYIHSHLGICIYVHFCVCVCMSSLAVLKIAPCCCRLCGCHGRGMWATRQLRSALQNRPEICYSNTHFSSGDGWRDGWTDGWRRNVILTELGYCIQ